MRITTGESIIQNKESLDQFSAILFQQVLNYKLYI